MVFSSFVMRRFSIWFSVYSMRLLLSISVSVCERPQLVSQKSASITGRGACPAFMYLLTVWGCTSRSLASTCTGWPMSLTMLCKCGRCAGLGARNMRGSYSQCPLVVNCTFNGSPTTLHNIHCVFYLACSNSTTWLRWLTSIFAAGDSCSKLLKHRANVRCAQ